MRVLILSKLAMAQVWLLKILEIQL
ncbi:hypothetical protein Pint_18089 [Pistacia integerrima]|uniref:Uncharacterized protein n=1 Tax=Pistacia integerrima TaxID=434235 RepID=A0ACC0YW62_9ROSI|nr:hypothetical protein Pint_18089 [Pistacia integerrima]